ncbi:MAG TPA: ligase-associated DNA damage response exonuclease [Stellaceae bacterium]|nr:ligase-associated DNA damage response exonuclease [Stellaceae bacterium]
MTALRPESWIRPMPAGLFVEPGGFYIDPVRRVDRAIVTHGHSDHARPDQTHVLATPETLAIMKLRLGERAGRRHQALGYGETIRIGEVDLKLVPAGHVLGSAQAVLEYRSQRVVVSGDYKRRLDPTCRPFEVVPCDLFVTEATFGLPVFRHPDARQEIDRLLHSVRLFPERCHLVGAYALGKAQRVIATLRACGYDAPIYIHGGLLAMCDLYQAHGVELGELRHVTGVPKSQLEGQIVVAPPSAMNDLWSRRLPDPLVAFASGWMRVKQRARQRGVELPLVISDHADWDELVQTMRDVQAPEIWVTHGGEEALMRQASLMGLKARALSLVGYDDEDET